MISSMVSLDFAAQVAKKGVAGKIASFLEGISALFTALALTIIP